MPAQRDSRGRFVKSGSAGAEVTDIDHGWERLRKFFGGKDWGVDVGFVGDEAAAEHETDEGSFTNAELGTWHEYGTGGPRPVPARAPLRTTHDEKKEAWLKLLRDATGLTIDGRISMRQAMDGVGLKGAADVKARIKAHLAPELSDRRKEEKIVGGKAGDTPLIHTSQLWGSIIHRVVQP